MLQAFSPEFASERSQLHPLPPLTKVGLFKLFILNGAASTILNDKVIYGSNYYKQTCESLGIKKQAYDCSKIQFTEVFSGAEPTEIFDFIDEFNKEYTDSALAPTVAVISAFQLFLAQDAFVLINLIMPTLRGFFYNTNSKSAKKNDKATIDDTFLKKLEEALEFKFKNRNLKEIDSLTAEVKKAYYSAARKYHPDKNPGHEDRFKAAGKIYEKWNKRILKSSTSSSTNKFASAVSYFTQALSTQYQDLIRIFGDTSSQIKDDMGLLKQVLRQSKIARSYSEVEGMLLGITDDKIVALKEKRRQQIVEERIKQLLRLSLVYFRVGFIMKCLVDHKHPGIALLTGAMALKPVAHNLFSYATDDNVKHTSSNLLFDSALDNNSSLWITGFCSLMYTLNYTGLSNFQPDFLGLARYMVKYGLGDTIWGLSISLITSFTWPNDKSLSLLLKTPLFAEILTIGAYTAYTCYRYGRESRDIGYFFFRGSDNECLTGSKQSKDLFPGLRVVKDPERFTKPAFLTTNALCTIVAASSLYLEKDYYKNGFLSACTEHITYYVTNNPGTTTLILSLASVVYFTSYKLPRLLDKSSNKSIIDNKGFINFMLEVARNLALPLLIMPLIRSDYLQHTVNVENCGLFNPSALPLSAKVIGIGIAVNALLLGVTHLLSEDRRTWKESIVALTGSEASAQVMQRFT